MSGERHLSKRGLFAAAGMQSGGFERKANPFRHQ
jgi:hypothetical protein